jgi:hypothetical protein
LFPLLPLHLLCRLRHWRQYFQFGLSFQLLH